MGLNRSTYYYKGQKPEDEELIKRLKELAAKRRRYGYRRLSILLKRAGFLVNHKRVYRLYRQEGLQVRRRKRKRVSKWRGKKLEVPDRMNQIWALDFASDALAEGRRIRLLAIQDMFSRQCLTIEVDTSLPGKRVVRALEKLIQSRGKPERLLIDNGPEFTGRALDEWAYSNGVQLQFIEPGKPMQNGYVESFIGKRL